MQRVIVCGTIWKRKLRHNVIRILFKDTKSDTITCDQSRAVRAEGLGYTAPENDVSWQSHHAVLVVFMFVGCLWVFLRVPV